MEQIERDHPGVKVFSLPSVDHPVHGRHIDLGVKGDPACWTRPTLSCWPGSTPWAPGCGPELVR